MVIMLEDGTTEKQGSVVCLLWAKELNAKDIHIELFPVYGGKCLSLKVFQLDGKRFADEEVETGLRKWLRQHSKDFYAAGVDALVKRWDKCINVGEGCVEEQMFFPGSNITLYVLYPV
jgi:hypothetical protein